jgi:hypothetical protein
MRRRVSPLLSGARGSNAAPRPTPHSRLQDKKVD